MIRTFLQLHPRPDAVRDVIDVYDRRGVLERARRQHGCRSADIGLVLGEPDAVVITAEWEDLQAYSRWLEEPSRAADLEALAPLLDTPPAPALLIDIVGSAEPVAEGGASEGGTL